MSNLKKLFGKNMKFIRKARGITQEQLGEMIGINQRQLTRIECGKNFPSADTLEKICATLDVPIKQMFDFQLEEEELAMTGTDNTTYKAVKFDNVIKLELMDKEEKLKKIKKYDKKQIDYTDSDLEMINLAKKSKKPITVQYSENAEVYKVTIYFPDGTFRHIKNNAGYSDIEGMNRILELLKEISDNPNKMRFVELAINAIDNKQLLDKLRATIDGMELLL